METITVLKMCPTSDYLEHELEKRFDVIKFWTIPDKAEFLKNNAHSIRAVVGSAVLGANAELIESLPNLEIVSSFSVGLDRVDLEICKEKGIRVANTPDVLTEDVADLAIGLILATIRGIAQCDKFVRNGGWKTGEFKLTTKVSSFTLVHASLMDLFSSIYAYINFLIAVCRETGRTAWFREDRQGDSEASGRIWMPNKLLQHTRGARVGLQVLLISG